MMTANELIRRAVSVATDYKTLYVSGGFGAPLVGRNVERYCNNLPYNKAASRTAMIRAAADQDPPVYAFDCVGLIKGLLWGWDGDPGKTYGGAVYASNGVPDIGETEMLRRCANVSMDFRSIVPGAVVWMTGHIGLYIGDGLAVECSPKWENKVQITAVANIGQVSGYNARKWTSWGLLPYVDYKEDDEMLTYEQWKEYMDRYRKELGALPADPWPQLQQEWEQAKAQNITDGSSPQALVTKQQVASMLVRAQK